MNHQTLFKNEDVFDTEFTPDLIHARDTQLRQLAETLRPALRGARPVNSIIRGPPGTGKTTCVRRVFTEIEDAAPRNVIPVVINCQKIHSTNGVFTTIYKKVFRQESHIGGIPLERITDRICAALIEQEAVLLVCLDDADSIVRTHLFDDVLRSLLRLHESYPGVRTGVVATMSTPSVRLAKILDPAVLSVYQPEEIRFPPYDEDDIHLILRDRVRCGLYPDVIPPAVLDRITEITVAEGDIRTGIALLKQVATHAEAQGRDSVEEHDLEARLREARRARVSVVIKDLLPDERAFLGEIAELMQSDPAVEYTLRSLYETLPNPIHSSYTTFSRRLNRLADIQAVDLVRRQIRGNSRTVRLHYDPATLCELCQRGEHSPASEQPGARSHRSFSPRYLPQEPSRDPSHRPVSPPSEQTSRPPTPTDR